MTTRRTFLKAGLEAGVGLAAAVACGGCGITTGDRTADLDIGSGASELRLPLEAHPALREVGGALLVMVGGGEHKILVFRRDGAALAAVDSRCTHYGCDVDFDPIGDVLTCPCHGTLFRCSGEVAHGVATRPLRSFPVRVEGDVVLVTLT